MKLSRNSMARGRDEGRWRSDHGRLALRSSSQNAGRSLAFALLPPAFMHSFRNECIVTSALIAGSRHRVSGHISVNGVHGAVLLRDHLGSVPGKSQSVAEGVVSRFRDLNIWPSRRFWSSTNQLLVYSNVAADSVFTGKLWMGGCTPVQPRQRVNTCGWLRRSRSAAGFCPG